MARLVLLSQRHLQRDKAVEGSSRPRVLYWLVVSADGSVLLCGRECLLGTIIESGQIIPEPEVQPYPSSIY